MGTAVEHVTEFCEAVWRQDAATVARLLPTLDVDGEDRWHRRPLAMAARYAALDLVEQLLARGADVNAGRRYLTPMSHAAARGADDIVAHLQAADAITSVVTQVYLGDRRAVAQAEPHDDEEGTPLLLHAAQALHADLVTDLLDRGLRVTATDRFGETALHRVADRRRADGPRAAQVARVLLALGAPIDHGNRDRVTPVASGRARPQPRRRGGAAGARRGPERAGQARLDAP